MNMIVATSHGITGVLLHLREALDDPSVHHRTRKLHEVLLLLHPEDTTRSDDDFATMNTIVTGDMSIVIIHCLAEMTIVVVHLEGMIIMMIAIIDATCTGIPVEVLGSIGGGEVRAPAVVTAEAAVLRRPHRVRTRLAHVVEAEVIKCLIKT